MRKFFGCLALVTLFVGSSVQVFAESQSEVITAYTSELVSFGLEEAKATTKATADVSAVISQMQGSQMNMKTSFETLKERVDNILKNDLRKEDAEDALETASDKNDEFMSKDPTQSITLQESVGGAPPYVTSSSDFDLAQVAAESAQMQVNRVLLSPAKPGSVPSGDLVTDFIPQIIRQLFRFAWVAVFIALTASGVMLVIAQGDDDKLGKAKSMIYYTLMGFALVAFAFAIVKGVTDIDFFRFI